MNAVKPTGKPVATFVKVAVRLTVKGPVTAPAWYSSQPMDGGFAQASPSMSVPLA